MTYYSSNMPTTVTYFPPAGQDAFGKLEYGTPVALKARWQVKAELFRDAQAREAVSKAVVYVSDLVEVGGRLALGTQTSPATGDEIRGVGVSPALSGAQELVKAWT